MLLQCWSAILSQGKGTKRSLLRQESLSLFIARGCTPLAPIMCPKSPLKEKPGGGPCVSWGGKLCPAGQIPAPSACPQNTSILYTPCFCSQSGADVRTCWGWFLFTKWGLIWQQHLKTCKIRTVLVGENMPINFPILGQIVSG